MENEIDWYNVVVLTITPILALYGIYTTKLHTGTLIFGVIYYNFTMLGITAGYHRLWCHKSYIAKYPLRLFLLLAGSSSAQGSVIWWCSMHRIHHRYTDTDIDPYNSKRGLLWAHIGWLTIKSTHNMTHIDISDLEEDKTLVFQHQYYTFLTIMMAIIIPTLIPMLYWNDMRGGFFFVAVLRLVLAHHATFCVNSLAHYLGSSPYDDKYTARDHLVTALITMGEGYHNFHHLFPSDYRNAIKSYHYDPTKWFIYSMYLLGIASDLNISNENIVNMATYDMKKKELDMFKNKISENDRDLLQKMTFDEFCNFIDIDHKRWIIIDNYVIDVSEFIQLHPGGQKLLEINIGKDVTNQFYGKIYPHSDDAKKILLELRVSTIYEQINSN